MKTFEKNVSSLVFMIFLLFSLIVPFSSLNASPGEIKWKKSFPERGQMSPLSPPISEDGLVYVSAPASDGTQMQSLYAIGSDGTVAWESKYQSLETRPPLPTVTVGPEGTIYVSGRTSGSTSVYAFNPDGTQKWEYSVNGGFFTLVSVAPDGTVHFISPEAGSGKTYKVFAINPDGSLKWKYPVGEAKTTYLSGIVSVDSQGDIILGISPEFMQVDQLKLIAISDEGNLKWEKTDIINANSGSIMPVYDGSNSMYLALENKIVSLDTQTGDKRWEYSASQQFSIWPPVIDDQGRVHCVTRNGTLHIVSSNGNKINEVSQPFHGQRLTSVTLGANGSKYLSLNSQKLLELDPNNNEQWTVSNLGNFLRFTNIDNNSAYNVNFDKRELKAIETTSQSLNTGPWPTPHGGKKLNKSPKVGKSCKLVPNLKLFPPLVHQYHGHTFLFVTGFGESDNEPADIDPSSVTLAGAKPEIWHSVSNFLWLKYDNSDLDFETSSRGIFTTADLSIKGKVKDDGCFETERTVFVWP